MTKPAKKQSTTRPKKVRTEEENAILLVQKQARAKAARAKIGQLSPADQGIQKKKKALQWVYRWGWSSSEILEIVGGSSRSGLAARLIKNGFLLATKTIGGRFSGGPAALLTLTSNGLNEVEKYLEKESDLLSYDVNPYKIDQTKIRHGELAQRSTAKMLFKKSITDYITEKMDTVKSEKSRKQHDVIWVMENGEKKGIEIELSAKWSHKLDDFILACIDSITEKKVKEIVIVTDSKAIQERYSKAFTINSQFGIWEKNDKGFRVLTKYRKIPSSIDGKISCIYIEK